MIARIPVLACFLAAGAPGDSVPPAAVVLSVPDLPDEVLDERLIAATRAHARALGFELPVVRHAATVDPTRLSGDAARGVLWITLEADGGAVLYLADVARSRVYSRRLPAVGGGAARVESQATVITQVVAAWLEGQLDAGADAVGLTLVEPGPAPSDAAPDPPRPVPVRLASPPQPPPSSPATPPPPPRWPRLRLGFGYTGSNLAAALPWHDGLALIVGWRPAPRVHLDLGFDWLLPATVRGDLVTLTLRRRPLSLAVGYAFPLGHRGDLRFAARLALDIVGRTAAAPAGVEVSPDRRRVFASAAVLLGAGVRPVPHVRVGFALGIELLLVRGDYVVLAPTRAVVLGPAPARLLVVVGLEFDLLPRPARRKNSLPAPRAADHRTRAR